MRYLEIILEVLLLLIYPTVVKGIYEEKSKSTISTCTKREV